MNRKKIVISLVVTAVFLAGLGIGVGLDSGSSHNPGKGKGRVVKEKNYTFAAIAQLLSVDSENGSVSIIVDGGSYTTKDFKFRQKSAVVDEGAEIFIGEEKVTLADISDFDRAYIFGRQIGNEVHINKIIVPLTITSE